MFQKTFGQSQPAFSGFNPTPTSTPFGQSTFAKPATTGFPSTSFGNTGTSLFGQTAQPATSGLFGQAAQGTSFGQAATQPAFGGFGTSTSNTNIFNQQPQQSVAPATGSLFGSPTPAFGQNKSFGFGNTGTTSLFGSQQQQQPTQTTSLFGQSNTAQSTNLFGSAPGFGVAAGPTGTTIKFQVITGTDTLAKNGTTQNISTRHNCITCMKEYENKSLEELRLEDYMANRKGPQNPTGGMFGTTQSTLSPFGAPSTSTTTGGLFASTDNKNLFGQSNNMNVGGFGSTPGVFGSTQQQSLFAKPNTGFGTATTSSAPGFGFNGAAAANPFGANAQAKPFGIATPQSNLFGTPSTQSGGFGMTSTPAFGAFGQPNQQQTTGGLFNQNKPTFNLGSNSSAGFGFGQNTATTAGTSLFGAKTTTPGFGTTPAFGTPTTTAFSTNQFGATTTTPSNSLFGNAFNKPAGGFSFGPTPTTNTGLGTGLGMGQSNLFGNTAAKPGGLFGSSVSFGSMSTGVGNTSFGLGSGLNTGLAGGTGLGLGTTGLGGTPTSPPQNAVTQQQLAALASVPFGDSPLFRNLLPATGRTTDVLQPTNPAARKAILNSNTQYKVSPRGGAKIKVKVGYPSVTKKSIFEGLEEDDGCLNQAFQPRPNPKRLNIVPPLNRSSNSGQPSCIPGVTSPLNDTEKENTSPRGSPRASPRASPGVSPAAALTSPTVDSPPTDWLRKNMDKARVPVNVRRSLNKDASLENTVMELRPDSAEALKQSLQTQQRLSPRYEKQDVQSPTSKSDAQSNTSSSTSDDSQELDESVPQIVEAEAHPTGIVCNRVGYYTIPSLDELAALLTDAGTCLVENFTVGREGYGNVFFPDSFDVAGLNLDDIVHFRHKEVVIYPDDAQKPPVGSGLNRRAQITLDCVWPMDKSTRRPIKEPERLAQLDYEYKLRRVCAKMNARFVEYRPQSGSWVFKVQHFSKYGLSDSDEEGPVNTATAGGKSATATGTGVARTVAASDLKKLKVRRSQQMKSGMERDRGLMRVAYTPELSNVGDADEFSPYGVAGFGEDDEDMECVVDAFGVCSPLDKAPRVWKSDFHQSPTTLLGKEMGTSTHKVQLMKSSFFGQDDEDDKRMDELSLYDDGADSIFYDPGPDFVQPVFETGHRSLFPRLPSVRIQKQNPSVPSSGPIGPVPVKLYVEPSQAAMMAVPPVVIKPRTRILKYHHGEVHASKSQREGRFLLDSFLLNGCKFRPGWGLDSTLLALSTAQSARAIHSQSERESVLAALERGRDESDYTSHRLLRVQIRGLGVENPSSFKVIERHLEIELKHSVIGAANGCPMIAPSSGRDALHEHCALARNLAHASGDALSTYSSQVWELCVALWGNLPDLDDQGSTSHDAVMLRREAVSRWLESVSERRVEKETAAIFGRSDSLSSPEKEEFLKGILSLLSGRQLQTACEKAQEYGDHYSALLLAQLSGSPAVRTLMREQLSAWQESGADQFINPYRIQLYLLVAGLPVFQLSNDQGTINTCHRLDWKLAFAIHLWYMCSPVASVSDALQQYKSAFSEGNEDSGDGYAKRPDPPYLDGDSDSFVETANKRRLNDVCYHLLELYSSRAHPLEQLLNPATHTEDPLDHRLSWCLMEVLESLDYTHISPKSAALIHTSFAAQLESNGLWHWAIFVLLHLKSDTCRKAAVLDMLGRHVELLDSRAFSEQEKFVNEKLEIAAEWIYRAKAIRAASKHRHHDHAWYLIRAGEWNSSQQVIMQHIAADAIINEDYDYLESLLGELASPERSSTISGWGNQGALLWDYLAVVKAVKALLASPTRNEAVLYQLEKLQPQLSSLCARIHTMPCRNAKDRLCQCEIAKRAAGYARSLVQFQRGEDGLWSLGLAHLISQLPLPEDYAQQELHELTNATLA